MGTKGGSPASLRHWLDLAGIRRSRGVSLEQIAESTKISLRFLRAIEEGEFDQLPGGIFNTSYIRQYAKAIDYEEAELLGYYHSRRGEVDPSDEHSGHSSNKTMARGFRLPISLARF